MTALVKNLDTANSNLINNNRLERIWILAKVDFKKRYYDSGLGLLWALINPLFRLAVYTLAFELIRTSNFENFSIYLFSGLLVWMFFTEVTNKALNLLKQKKYLLENIDFNWIDIFIASSLSSSIGLFFNFAAYFILSVLLGLYPSIYALWLPLLLFFLIIISLSFSIIIASINVFFKDIDHIWSIVILAGFWTAPIFFPIESIEAKFPILLYIHPATSILVNVRNVLFYNVQVDYFYLIWSMFYGIVVFFVGVILFKYSKTKVFEKL